MIPGLVTKVLDERDELKRSLTVFVNGKDARLLDGARMRLAAGDLVTSVGLMSGG